MSSYEDAVRKHEEMLLEKLRETIDVDPDMRLFESAEGTLAPLTVEQSAATAKQARQALAKVSGRA